MNYQLIDELEKSQDLMLKELKKINAKGDLTKEELCLIKEIAEAIYKTQIAESMDAEAGDSEYYDDGMMSHRGSYARGRSPRTGRYISRYDGGMSRHSIEDRMVAALEDQMDNASSDYERKKVGEWISKIRAAEMK